MKLIALLLATTLLVAFSVHGQEFHDVACEGAYTDHLQGICVDDDSIYWSFTTFLVKTDLDGKLQKKIAVADHHGDLCFREGKLYVAVNLGKFNDPDGNADSWIYVYDAATLEELARHAIPEVFHGAGGVALREGHFFVVGGLPSSIQENYVYEYDEQFKFLERHVIPSGHTHLGIQTAAFAGDRWWFGCYGFPKVLLVTDTDFKVQGRYEFEASVGIVGLPDGRFLVGRDGYEKGKGRTGSARIAVTDKTRGLRCEEK